MLVFEIGLKILLSFTLIFFLVFFFLCSSWAKPKRPERMYLIGAIISILYTFWFFIGGFLVLVLIFLAWQYLPKLFELFAFLF